MHVDGKSVLEGETASFPKEVILRLRVFVIALSFHYNLPSLHSRSVFSSASKESIPRRRVQEKPMAFQPGRYHE